MPEAVEPEHAPFAPREVIRRGTAHRTQSDDGDVERSGHRAVVIGDASVELQLTSALNATPRSLRPP